MSNDKEPNGLNKNDSVSIDALTAAFTAAITASQPGKKVDFGEFINRPENHEPKIDPEGAPGTLIRPVFQNSQPIQIKGCSQKTLDNLNNLKPGRYLGNAITVTLRGDVPFQETHINYPCARVDERMKIYQLVSSFSDLVSKIAAEQGTEPEKL